jgi:hypothetical protein
MATSKETFLIYKVLRFSQAGHFNPSRLFRINRDFRFWNSLVVKGGALIHRSYLVAWPVGSEWRNHHPYQVIIQANQ